MAINPFEIKNYLQEMKDNETFAFQDAVVFNKYLELLAFPAMEIQEVLRQLMQERSIDTAIGAQLDIIGNIVGQSRIVVNADIIPYFGFLGSPESKSYGDLNNTNFGGYYWDINQPLAGNVTLNDEQYRIFIKGKILKNITRATPEDVIQFIKFVFDIDRIQISVDSGGHALIMVSDDASEFERNVLRYYFQNEGYRSYFVPKTIGVNYLFGEFPSTNFFAFLGVEGAMGYGTLETDGPIYDGTYDYDGTIKYNGGNYVPPNSGGRYASLFEI